MQIIGIANSYASAPVTAPTSLSGTPSTTSVSIAFIAPTNDGGTAITNYEYSFNGSSWTALSPADAATPVTVGSLSPNTAYTIYLRAVNILGSGPASSGLSVTTLPIFISASGGTTTDYSIYRSHEFTSSGSFVVSSLGSFNSLDILVVAGGGGGGNDRGGAGGAGGFRTSTQTLGSTGTISVTVGGPGGGGSGAGYPSSGGGSSISGAGLSTINATGGGHGSGIFAGGYYGAASGGSGGGGNPGSGPGSGNAGGYSPVEGYRGGNSYDGWMGAGGGGAAGVGGDNSYGAGGSGASNSYKTGSNITYSNGGNGQPSSGNSGNRGAGGGGATAGVGGAVVIRYRIA